MREIISRGVVARLASDEGEVQPRQPASLVDGEVGVVREHLVDRVVDGVAGWLRHALREQVDDPSAPVAGLEHEARAGGPARLQVHHRPHFLRRWIARDERLRPEQVVLLAFVHQQEDGAFRRGPRLQRPRDLQSSRNARSVVARARAGGHRVIVHRQQHPLARALTVEPRDDVGHACADADRSAGKRFLGARLIAEPLQLRDDALPDARVGVALSALSGARCGSPSPTSRRRTSRARLAENSCAGASAGLAGGGL